MYRTDHIKNEKNKEQGRTTNRKKETFWFHHTYFYVITKSLHSNGIRLRIRSSRVTLFITVLPVSRKMVPQVTNLT